ncbi:MAG: hypothetical protein IPO93_13035 [Actinobacteria bacterium]|nr:hypothetical protein [Actinomycetota bacterium]
MHLSFRPWCALLPFAALALAGCGATPAAGSFGRVGPAWPWALGCPSPYVEVPQEAAVANMVRVCSPRIGATGTWIENLSDTSLLVSFGADRETSSYRLVDAPDDMLHATALETANAVAGSGPGTFLLPAGSVVKIGDPTAPGPALSVTPDVDHSKRALAVGAAADLFGQALGPGGDQAAVGELVGSCVLKALLIVKAGEVSSLTDAMPRAQECQDAAAAVASTPSASPAPTQDEVLASVIAGIRARSPQLGGALTIAESTGTLLPRT